MTIRVYSKPGCGKCEAAKDKLQRMGFAYQEQKIEDYVEHHDGWREDGSVAVLAAHSLLDTLPLIAIDGEFTDYPGAMSQLKAIKKESSALAVSV